MPEVTWTASDMRAFMKRNALASPADVPTLDAAASAALDWGPASTAQDGREAALTYRRLYNLGQELDLCERLLERGIESASQVASLPRDEFARRHAQALGLSAEDATAIHERATRIQNRTLHLMATVHGVTAQPHFRAIRVNHVGDDLTKHFEDLPSYQEIFGSLDYCACEACKSIFGPAAYLVDLLRIVDERITTPNEDTIPKPLRFDVRRKDIARIPLTCEMTNDTLPYLAIVIERLMAEAEKLLGVTDPAAVRAQMATKLVHPANLPFNTELDRIRVLLQQLDLSLAGVLAAWRVQAQQTVRETLGLSVEQLAIVETPESDPAVVAAFYGITGDLQQLAAVRVFMDHTGKTLAQVQDLVVQRMTDAEIAAGVPQHLFVNHGMGVAFLQIVADADGNETIANLDVGALDRLNRLDRLAATCGWSPAVTDWLLRAVKAGATPVIDAPALADLVRVQRYVARFGITPTQAGALFGPLKTYGQDGETESSLFDQLFNGPGLAAGTSAYHPEGNPLNSLYTDKPLSWKPGDAATTAALMRVLPGLAQPVDAVTALGIALFGTTAAQLLTVEALSALYRHSLLSRCINLPMDQYLMLLDLLGLHGKSLLTGPQLDLAIDRATWMQGARLDVYQLAYVTRGHESVYVDPLLQADKVEPWLTGLAASIRPDDEDATERLDAAISTLLGITAALELPAREMAVAAIAPPAPELTWVQALLAPIPEGEPPPYLHYATEVLRRVTRWAVLSAAAAVAPEVLACVRRHPTSFGLPADFETLDVDGVRHIAELAAMIRRFGDRRGDLIRYVDLSAQATPPADALAALHAATGWDAAEVRELLSKECANISNAVQRLLDLEACLAVTAALGTDVAFVRDLAAVAPLPATSDDYERVAKLLLQAVSATYGPSAWQQVSGEVEGRLRVHERDGLLGIVLAGLRAQYEDVRTPDDVYQFLLTDVQTGPEAQISYVKEALNAVQLYLQRCRLRLEPGVEKVEIAEIWWEWMLNYRVWEANRQIFVYPENYLIPSLRRDQTVPFRKLASDLLQSEITPAYVDQAYGDYLKTLMSRTQLVLVDAFAGEVVDERRGGNADALYLFARTATTPATFFACRKLDGGPWSEWEEIDLTITSTDITPVYAFDKLFIFWVQLDTLSSSSVTLSDSDTASTTNSSYRATIRYSFQDRGGAWVQPQTLAENVVVDYRGGAPNDDVPLRSSPLFDDVFDMSAPPWHKVLAIRAAADNIAPGLTADPDPERLVIVYGQFLNNLPTIDPGVPVATTNPDAAAFQDALFERAAAHNRLARDEASGSLPGGRVFVLDASLEPAVAVRRGETTAIDPYWPAAPVSQYRAVIDELAGTVQLVVSDTPIVDLYLGDSRPGLGASAVASAINATSFVSDGVTPQSAALIFGALVNAGVIGQSGIVNADKLAGLDLFAVLKALLAAGTIEPIELADIQRVLLSNVGAPVLFGSLDADGARVLAVQDQPGSFVFDNGEQALLMRPLPPVPADGGSTGDAPFSTLADGLLLSNPPLNRGSFTMGAPVDPPVPYEASSKAFELLQGYGVIDPRGFPLLPEIKFGLKVLLQTLVNEGCITEDQTDLFTRLLLNYPIAFGNAFANGRISPELSRKLYDALQAYTVVDDNGRVVLDILTGRVITLVLGHFVGSGPGQITQADLVHVYRTLVQTPICLTLSYLNDGVPGPFVTSGRFGVTRVSTAAVPRLQRALLVGGVQRMLSRELQNIPVVPILPFDRLLPAAGRVVYPDAIDAAQVDFEGLYGRYFWELFFHGPMLVADTLASSQRFLESVSWLRHVFDPAAPATPLTPERLAAETRHLIALELAGRILAELATHDIGDPPKPIVSPEGWVNPAVTAAIDLSFLKTQLGISDDQVVMVRNVLLNERLATAASRYWQFRPFRGHTLASLKQMLTDGEAIATYENEPFDPFAIARLRIGAFEKATVMQYIDTLLQWGDHLFTQDTWESITAASMLYVYASDLLGPRPQQVGVCRAGPAKTFEDIRNAYEGRGGIPAFLIYLESTLPIVSSNGVPATAIQDHGFNDLGAYFCVPENSKLVGYWDRVEDRLYKIRHSMDIKGQLRSLALFEPPLDPLALVRASGASNSAMAAASSPRRTVRSLRFNVLIDRARGLAASVTALGNQILSARERRDGEALTVLQTTQQAQILTLATDVAQRQIDESLATIASLEAARAAAQTRLDFYSGLIADDLSASEELHLEMMIVALIASTAANIAKTASAIGYAVPQVGSPFAITYGGIQLGSMVDATGGVFTILSEIATLRSDRALTMAGYERRRQDWQLQRSLADHDLDGLDEQIAAARARLAVVQRQLHINRAEIASARAVEQFLRTKFTSAQLYEWLVGNLSILHFQTYLQAMAAAHDAQTAFQFEYSSNSTFLDVELWDGAHKGLLAGEGLTLALERMATAEVKLSTRKLEIERLVSLAELDPLALDLLKNTGACEFELPELMYDYDYPGHYQRQINTISITIPPLLGPTQSLKATLTQTWNAVALEPKLDAVLYLMGKTANQPANVRLSWAAEQQVALSHGNDDSGMFSVNLWDPKYFPFQRTGAVSRWKLELRPQANRFDLQELPDVLVTVRYTALADADLRGDVIEQLEQTPLRAGYYVDARRSLPEQWTAFMNDHLDPARQTLAFEFTPQWAGQLRALELNAVSIRVTADVEWPANVAGLLTLTIAQRAPVDLDVHSGLATLAGLDIARADFTGTWKVAVNLDVVRSTPALRALLDGYWLDPARFQNLDLIDVCSVTTW